MLDEKITLIAHKHNLWAYQLNLKYADCILCKDVTPLPQNDSPSR